MFKSAALSTEVSVLLQQKNILAPAEMTLFFAS